MTSEKKKILYGSIVVPSSSNNDHDNNTARRQRQRQHHHEVIPRRRMQTDLRRGSSISVYRTFLQEFWGSSTNESAPVIILLVGFLTALGIGSLIGVIPQVTTQRYAELYFGYGARQQDEMVEMCNSITIYNNSSSSSAQQQQQQQQQQQTPLACIRGAEYAQSMASYAALARYTLALLSNSVAGSYTDKHGRRGVQILSLFFISLSPMAFFCVQIFPTLDPTWFFVTDSLSSIINLFSIGFTQLTDVVASRHRAAAYGFFFGAFMGGIAISPLLAIVLSHWQITIFSCAVRVLALLIAILFLPETFPTEHKLHAIQEEGWERNDNHVAHSTTTTTTTTVDADSSPHMLVQSMLRPFREMAILRRSTTLMLIATGAFLSKMVFSADVTLFFFYAERNLGVKDTDVAGMMFVTGLLGVLVQAVLLKYLISLLGERGLLLASFTSGTIHNLIYGLAPKKWMLYVGLCLAQFSNTNYPLLSSLASKCVSNTEQGRIQGALFSLTSLAEAMGPVCFNYVYQHYRWKVSGPGTMFVFGALLYSIGLITVSRTPRKDAAAATTTTTTDDTDNDEDERVSEDGQKDSLLIE